MYYIKYDRKYDDDNLKPSVFYLLRWTSHTPREYCPAVDLWGMTWTIEGKASRSKLMNFEGKHLILVDNTCEKLFWLQQRLLQTDSTVRFLLATIKVHRQVFVCYLIALFQDPISSTVSRANLSLISFKRSAPRRTCNPWASTSLPISSDP